MATVPGHKTPWWSLHDARALFWIMPLAVIVIGVGLGFRDPWPADEPRFAQVAREMVESGRWLFPTRGGELYSDKPPVFMWLIAAFLSITGNLRLSFLLPSALAALGTLAVTHQLCRDLWNTRTANIAALLLLATLQFVLQARTAQIDALVCFMITLGMAGLLRHLLLGPALGWYVTAWVAMGVGVITKGVGFLPILLFVPYVGLLVAGRYAGRRDGTSMTVLSPGISLLLGPLAFMLAVSLWLVPMTLSVELSDDPALHAYRQDILFRQTGERYANTWTHIEPWYYFLVSVIPLLWLPLSVAIPWLLRPWVRAIKQRDPRIVMLLAWIVLVIAFFSASPGKRGVYILPALPALVLIAAPFAEDVLRRRGYRVLLGIVLGVIGMLTIGIGLSGYAGIESLATAEQEYGIRPWSLLLIVGLLALAALASMWKGRAAIAWLAFIVPFWILYGSWGYKLASPARTPAQVYRNLVENAGTDIRLGLIDFREQWLLFAPVPLTHFGFATSDIDQQREAWRWIAEQSAEDGTVNAVSKEPGSEAGAGLARRLLMSSTEPWECFKAGAGIPLGRAHSGQWFLLGPEDRLASCPPPENPVPRFDYFQPGALPL